MKKHEPTGYYKTEEQLKEEAKQRAAEQARMQALKPPPSPKKKQADNFWYHYKWHTVAVVFGLVLAVFFVRDVLFRTDPDVTVILATASPVSGETAEALQSALMAVAWDFNGDGKVLVQVDAIYVPGEAPRSDDSGTEISVTGQMDYANVMKFSTVIAAGLDPILLLDDDMYAYMLQMAAGSEQGEQGEYIPNTPTEAHAYAIFERLEVAGGGTRIPLPATALADVQALVPLADTAFSLRVPSGEKNADYHAYCRELLEAMVVAQAG